MSKGAPILIIGQHKLTGRVVNLLKPLAVVYKTTDQPPTKHLPSINTNTTTNTPKKQKIQKLMTSSPNPNLTSEFYSTLSALHEKTEVFNYEIMHVVKKKYVFDKRPEHYASEGFINMNSVLNKK